MSKTNSNPVPNVPKVCILGIGQMGLVCSGALTMPDPQGAGDAPRANVTMWGYDDNENGMLAQSRKSDRLPDSPSRTVSASR